MKQTIFLLFNIRKKELLNRSLVNIIINYYTRSSMSTALVYCHFQIVIKNSFKTIHCWSTYYC